MKKTDLLTNSIISLENEVKVLREKLDYITNKETEIIDKQYREDWEWNWFLGRKLQEMAGYQTAKFIIQNMNKTPTVPRSIDILGKNIEHVTIDGFYLEFGVYSVRTINEIAAHTDKIVYGFDSFEGLPEKWRTGFTEDTFKVDGMPELKDNVELVKGWFDETLPVFLESHKEKCAFVHMDCNLYSSIKTALNLLDERIVKGTVISFDEYFNYPGWQEGEYKAFKEYCEEKGVTFEYLYYCDSHEQVSVIVTGRK